MNSQIPALDNLPKNAMPILHGLIALWGLLDCFFGLRIFKVTVKIFLAFAGAVGAAYLAARYYPDFGGVLLGACVAGLILGFILGWFVYKIGVVLLAIFAGFVLISPLTATLGSPLDVIIPCAVGVVAGFAAFILLEPVVIATTAVTGAFRLVFGVAFFMGGTSIAQYVSGNKSIEVMFFRDNGQQFIITLAVAALGFGVQFVSWRKSKKDSEDKE